MMIEEKLRAARVRVPASMKWPLSEVWLSVAILRTSIAVDATKSLLLVMTNTNQTIVD